MKINTLVMTASVNPNGMADLSEASRTNREDQYIRTLKFYSRQECISYILFVENSNWDLTKLKNAVDSSKVEYISLDANTYPREWGKGHGEMYILDRATEHLIASGRPGVFVKVTGRFPVLNIASMMREFEKHDSIKLAVDVIEHNLFRVIGRKWCSSGCRTIIYACDTKFYMDNLYGHYKELPSRFWSAERLMRYVWEQHKDEEGVFPRFRHEPHLSGAAGATNHAWITANNYDSLLARAKRSVKQLFRWFLPGVWL